MKPKKFVEKFREETGKHIENWFDTLKNDLGQTYLFKDATLKQFISYASQTEKRGPKWEFNRYLHSIKATEMIEFEIDGCKFRILNKPTALAYVYKHANRAI